MARFLKHRIFAWPSARDSLLASARFLQSRDHALVALLALTGLRIQEALALTKEQFLIRNDCIRLISAKTLKRGMERSNITLPKRGALSPLTFNFEQWLLQARALGRGSENNDFPSIKRALSGSSVENCVDAVMDRQKYRLYFA